MTKQKAQRPTVCRICKEALPVASTGRVRYTCSDRCRQIRQRYGDGNSWREAVEYKQQRVAANKQIRKIESRVGSLDIPLDPKFGNMTLRERIRRHLMRGQPVTFCVECRMPYVADTWRKYKVCSNACYQRHRKRINYLDDWCYDHMVQRTWWDRTLYIRDHIKDTICKHCGWTFPNENRKRKYCCDTCKDAAYWKRRPIRTCKGCGERYRGSVMGCSPQCINRAKLKKQHCARCNRIVKPGAEILPNTDTRIPKSFARRRWAKAAVFCSGRCRDALGWLPMRKSCEECKQPYYAADQRAYRYQRFCSVRCADRVYQRAKQQRRQATAPVRLCLHCGTELPRERKAGGQAGHCSDACKQERNKILQRDWARKRRAEQRAIPISADWLVPERVGDEHKELGYVESIEAELVLVGDKL